MYIKVTDNYGSRNIKLDFEIIGSMLLSPQERSKAAIANTAFIIGEMACEKNIQPLIKAAENNNIRIIQDENITAADIVVQIWIQDRDLLEQIHGEIIATRPREFEYFQGNQLEKQLLLHSNTVIAQIESDLGEYFFKNNCGSSCKIFFFPGDKEIRILIKQQAEKYDVLVYNLTDNAIAINAGAARWQKQAYLEVIGCHLFGFRDYFLHKPQYTLDPISENGSACLYSSDIGGIDNIKLTEVLLYSNDDYGTKKILNSADLFVSKEFHETIAYSTQIASATFGVYFSGNAKARPVTITLPHTIACMDEDKPVIDAWLKARGFLIMGGSL